MWVALAALRMFQSTLPVGGATAYEIPVTDDLEVSIHAPRGGSDSGGEICKQVYVSFNPRSPWGERRRALWIESELEKFQSTLPVGGATYSVKASDITAEVSIHAPRGGSDTDSVQQPTP